MKKKELTSLRVKSLKDLAKMVSEKKLEAKKKSLAAMGGKEKNLKAGRNLRKDIAQLLTLVKETEIIEKLKIIEEAGKTTK